MMYLADYSDPDRVYVVASAAGADANPAWFNNLVAAPEVEVEIGTEKLAARAEVVAEPARTEIFNKQAALYSGFAAYQAKTMRTIPVVALALEPRRRAGRS